METDDEIINYSKISWKNHVKTLVKQFVLIQLNRELSEQKHGSQIIPYKQLKKQKYLDTLQPNQTRKLFQVRAGVVDVKTIRKYWYDDSICRLCGEPEENVDHVVNVCRMVPRTTPVSNILSDDIDEMVMIAERCITFAAKVKELQDGLN